MPKAKSSRVLVLAIAALLLGSLLLLSCQPAQPVATPEPGEKAAATTKPAETAAGKAATTAAPAKAAEKPVKGGGLRVSLIGDANSLDPHPVTACSPCNNIYELLIKLDKDGKITKEGLFKDWTISNDGKSITFKLQEGVKFHDGTAFDAAAVKFNIDRMKDPATKSPYASNYARVSVEVVDSLTVRFNLTEPDPILLDRMGTQGGMMVSPAAVQRYGQDFARKPVGTGPFEFVEWVPSDHITVKRFAGYWRKDKDGMQLPYLDQLIMSVITDPTVAFANLRTGQVNLYNPPTAGMPPEQIPVLKSDPNLTYANIVGTTVRGIDVNTVRPPFNNKALRQAVALALDREGMASRLGEAATFSDTIFHPMGVGWGADPKAGAFPARDVAKAKAKMSEAGFPSGGVKAKLLTRSDPNAVSMVEILKANMAEIGIAADIEVVAQAVWLEKTSVIGGDYQIAEGSTGIQLPDPGHIFGLMFHSKGTRNYFGPYSNPKVDELIDKAGSIYDQKERKSLYEQAAKIIADDVPFIPANVANTLTPINKKVRNFVPNVAGTNHYGEVWLAQ